MLIGLSPIPLYHLAQMFTPLQRTWQKDLAVGVVFFAVGMPLVLWALFGPVGLCGHECIADLNRSFFPR